MSELYFLRWLEFQMFIAIGAFWGVVIARAAPAGATVQIIDIPAGVAQDTLRQFAQQTACQIVFSPETVRDVPTHAIRGELSILTALTRMLEGTSLMAVQDGKTRAFAVLRKRASPKESSVVLPVIRRVADPSRPGLAWAVTVADVPLVITGQLLPWGIDGAIAQGAAAQVKQLLANLEVVLAECGSSLESTVRLNLYVVQPEITKLIMPAVAARYANAPVALTLVQTSLADERALVALDAIAARTGSSPIKGGESYFASGLPRPRLGAHAFILPAGRKIFIAGRAEKGADMAEGAGKSLSSLIATLRHLELEPVHAAQVKAYFNPGLGGWVMLEEQVRLAFGDHSPAFSAVEWKSETPAEIEMLAYASEARTPGDPLVFLMPAGPARSARYSRMVDVAAGQSLIFTAGLHGARGDSPFRQMETIFGRLGGILAETGGSFRHLVKATYYQTDPESLRANKAYQDTYYDRRRPPAMSGAIAAGTGREGVTASFDWIGVPVPDDEAVGYPGN
ncbi:MAG: hypothetical protein ACREIA_21785 [Opitutaceae bacterium]